MTEQKNGGQEQQIGSCCRIAENGTDNSLAPRSLCDLLFAKGVFPHSLYLIMSTDSIGVIDRYDQEKKRPENVLMPRQAAIKQIKEHAIAERRDYDAHQQSDLFELGIVHDWSCRCYLTTNLAIISDNY